MTTAIDIINRAAKTTKILAAGETLEDEDAQDILDSLNEMLHAWEINYGIDLGHSDLDLTDTVYLPDSHLQAVRYNLAKNISHEYNAPLSPVALDIAETGLRMLQAYYCAPRELQIDDEVKALGHYSHWRGIING